MHSTQGVTKGVMFHHNGDYSGEVVITVNDNAAWEFQSDRVYQYRPPNDDFMIPGYHELRIPFEDLKRMVAMYVYKEKARRVEELEDDDEILGIPKENTHA